MALHEIYTAQDLKDFRDLVNAGSTTESAILMNDIDLEGSVDNKWTPIGSDSKRYSGTFNGNGHTISGIYVRSITYSENQGFIGFAQNANIKNLIVDGYVAGYFGFAGICGNVWNSNITNCINKAEVTGVNDNSCFAGGICGSSVETNIINCINEGYIHDTSLTVGSYVWFKGTAGISGGAFDCTIKDCINRGDIWGNKFLGGIAGEIEGGICLNCVNDGTVFGFSYIAGICALPDYETRINNCVNKKTITGNDYVGGIAAGEISDNISNCVNEGTIVCSGSHYGGIIYKITRTISYSKNNYYLNTSCDRAGTDKDNNIMITMPGRFESYIVGNAPVTASLIDDFITTKNFIIPKLYPHINDDMTTVTFSNWVTSGNLIGTIVNDVVMITVPIPPLPKKVFIIEK
jgi:hypothetical protein